MRMTNIMGILLIVIGVLALAYQGITYTTREKVIDLGPIKATRRFRFRRSWAAPRSRGASSC